KFREDIEKALAEYGEYSKEIDTVVNILHSVGVKTTKGFTVIERSTLEKERMQPAIVGILMEKF
ncbi:hypothetical protein MTO96_050334, partial [Rhipicephalus appendiculatus]